METAQPRRASRLTRWLVGGPPILFLVAFFLLPALIMVFASFREHGEFGGLAPLLRPEGGTTLGTDTYAFLVGVSLLLFFRQVLDLTLGLLSILIAHITFSIGFVAIVVRVGLAGLDESLLEAARDLGASPWQAFRRVTLPLILPSMVAGWLVAFTLSIDDFVITFFTAGAGVTTLPLQIYSMIKVAVSPEVNAVSTLLMALTLSLVAIASRLAPHILRGRA